MDKIRPHLWFDTQAVEAAQLYVATFADSAIANVATIRDTPSGDTDIVSFRLFGLDMQAISAGPHFTLNPSISLLVRCRSAEEVDAYWRALSDGGEALMPLDAYPFSKRYGWTTDRYGLSWQVMLADEGAPGITPFFLFVGDVAGKAEEAIASYTSIFPGSRAGEPDRFGAADAPEREGTIRFAEFTLAEQRFAAMDSALDHRFAFNEAFSLMVGCETQAEIDRYWEALSAVPEAEQCGWLKDRFGVSWQIVPTALDTMLAEGSDEQVARVTAAFLQMKKFDLAELERAYEGA